MTDVDECIADMRIANDAVDETSGGSSEYYTALIALALIARELLRRLPVEKAS